MKRSRTILFILPPRVVNIFLVFAIFLVTSCQKENAVHHAEQKTVENTLYDLLPTTSTDVDFTNQLTDAEDFNIVEYLYYYNGGGVAIGDVNNDSLPDLYFTANQLPNQLYLNRGSLKFENVTESAGVAGTGDWKTGVTMADVNADGWLDIYVCQVGAYKTVQGRNQLFINNQDGTFTERAADYGLDFKGFSTQAVFFDYDIDGDLDMFLLNHSVHAPENYSNTKMRSVRNELTGDRLYRNDNGRFTDVTETAGIFSTQISYGLDITVSDLDDNGCPDLYISNDFHENDYLYYNNCDGTFREGIYNSMRHTTTFSMGNDVADLNNDLRPDVMSLDMKPANEVVLKNSAGADPYNIYQYKLKFGYHYQYPRNALQWNRGNLLGENVQFSEIGQLANVAATDWSWSVLLHDMDNDGWKDIFISNGIWQRPNDLDYQKFISNRERQAAATNLELVKPMPSGIVENYAFRNQANSAIPDFKNISAAFGLNQKICANGAAHADLDGDGDLDLVVNNLNAAASIFKNNSREQNGNNYLKINLLGDNKNPFGVGAKIVIRTGDQTQMLEQFPVRGFQSSVDYQLHFGLGTTDRVDELRVRWQSGKEQILTDIAANQTLSLRESEAEMIDREAPLDETIFVVAEDNLGINFTHQENAFIDFDREKLLLHQLSTEGANITTGDLNGDGLVDVHIGGARQQAGAIFYQNKNSSFTKVDLPILQTDAFYEDVDAAIFDADNDGDNDLYVVSGGGEFTGAAVADRLYLNEGGNFIKTENALPKIETNGAFVLAADFNGDSFTDLLIGSRSEVGKYGIAPQSYLLINDGKGVFTEQTAARIPDFTRLGMLTDAAVLAKNNDGSVATFAVVGEFLPLTIFTKKDNIFIKKELPNSSGWWNCITIADVDNDGDLDFLAGNQGLNADLRPTIESPINLYAKDFDKNGSIDPILSYYKQNQPYTYASKDELIGQIVALRKRYNDYASFAASTFTDIFPSAQTADATTWQAETFASVYVENLGNNDFKITPLPLPAQIAPIQSFALTDINQDQHLDILVVGNFYGNQPNLGRADASFGQVLLGDGKGNFTNLGNEKSGFGVDGDARTIQILELNSKQKISVITKNNAAVQVLKIKK